MTQQERKTVIVHHVNLKKTELDFIRRESFAPWRLCGKIIFL
jgi:hypothetical protein